MTLAPVSATPGSGEIAQTLDRGLQILETLGHHNEGLSVAELVDLMGINRTVVARLLNTLEARGFVERRRGRYLVGVAVLSLARRSGGGITGLAIPLLEAAAEKLNATAVLHVSDGDEAVTLASIESPEATYRMGFRVGARTPMDVAAHGLAILAGRAPVPGEREEVTEARAAGYAVTSGEVLPGHVGISSPVKVGGRCEASIGVVVTESHPLSIEELGRQMVRTAERLALELG